MSGTLVAHTTIGFQFDAGFDAGKASAAAAVAQDERELITRLCEGDEAAYEILIERFEHPIYNLVSRLTNDPGDAPDVVQEVFLKVFRNVQSFRGQSSLKTWIYRIAVMSRAITGAGSDGIAARRSRWSRRAVKPIAPWTGCRIRPARPWNWPSITSEKR